MPHADYLSRNPIVAKVNQIQRPRNWAHTAQAADQETQDLLQRLQDGTLDANRIFHDEHEHIGVDKTADLILKHFWFPGLKQFVSKYVSHCLTCISKKRVPRAPLQNITSWEKPDLPFDTVHVDALGPLPASTEFKYVLIIVDSFSKYCLLYPMSRQDADELKKVITQMISLFGVPKLMITDKGRMFESNSFVRWINDMGCELHSITPEMHHANGQVERYMRTVLNMIKVEVNHKSSSWADTLWKLQLVINITKHRTTQTSPLNLLIETKGTTPVIRALVRDVATENASPNREALREISRSRAGQLLDRNRTQQDERENRRRRSPREFNIDDLVFVIKHSQSTGKLDPRMRGPYKVVNILPSGRYELKLISGDYGKTTQAAAQHMVAWRGEWSTDACAAFFDHADDSEPTQLSTPAEAELSATSRDDSLIPPTTSGVNQPAVPTPNDTDTSIPPTQSDNDMPPPPTYDGAGIEDTPSYTLSVPNEDYIRNIISTARAFAWQRSLGWNYYASGATCLVNGEFADEAAVRIFPTVRQIGDYNEKISKENAKLHRTYQINAVDEAREVATYGRTPPENVSPKDVNSYGGFLPSIKIDVESQVMLRRNIAVSEELVNGAMGIIKKLNGRPGGEIKWKIESYQKPCILNLMTNLLDLG
ncbi:hypothetical protein EVAR_85228_1 [Eumeta japonica]|uniref:RNA-directed DNA polymerase n=1 Tax=Eumeta variegata TaxID=151549 RepID=A0A4C1W1M8_EUMVA|nr:hypothetical protein EVAR_85228_1 [Eumeta japonica]